MFEDRCYDNKMKDILNNILMTMLPVRSAEGYACYYSRLFDTNPKKFIFVDAVRRFRNWAALAVLDVWQYAEGSWPGFIMVFDLAGMTMAHLVSLDLHTLQQYLHYTQEALLLKLKSVYIVKAPPIMDKLMLLVKPFLKKEILNILHIHVIGSRALDQFYPMDCLPKEAGGKYKSVEECRDDTLAKMKASSEYFIWDNKKRVVESKRTVSSNGCNIYQGLEGSFKELNID